MKKVNIYYDNKYGRLYASDFKRNDLLLGEVEVGDTFKILYDNTDCNGCIKRTSFEGGLDDEEFLGKFTLKCFSDELGGMDPDDNDIDIEYYVIEYKVVEKDLNLPDMWAPALNIEYVESGGYDIRWSVTYSRKRNK